MRKGKKILALASIFAGVALVGTTFAAWAVTDNAPSIGWKITGDKTETDISTHFVTLEYGESTSYNSVGNLEPGELRKAATIKLKASFAGDTKYWGRFSISMAQETKSGESPKYLKDYLRIYAVDKDLVESAIPGAAVQYAYLHGDGTPVLSGTHDFQMTSGEEETVYVIVELLDSVTPSILNEIKKDIVDVTVNWDHTSDHEQGIAVTSVPVYLKYAGNGANDEKVYCYAWGGKSENAAYPGVEMVKEGNGLYSYQLDSSKYTKVIFNNNGHATAAFKTAEEGMTLTETILSDTPCWDTTISSHAWVAKPVADASLLSDYYVVGDFPEGTSNDWKCVEAYAMAKPTTDSAYYESAAISFTEGQKFKVRNNSNEAVARWFSNASTWEGCGFTIDDEMNLVVTFTGSRKVQYYPNGDNGNYVVFANA